MNPPASSAPVGAEDDPISEEAVEPELGEDGLDPPEVLEDVENEPGEDIAALEDIAPLEDIADEVSPAPSPAAEPKPTAGPQANRSEPARTRL